MKVRIEIELEYDDDSVSPHLWDTEHALRTNFDVAEGIFDLGVGVSPKSVEVDIDVNSED